MPGRDQGRVHESLEAVEAIDLIRRAGHRGCGLEVESPREGGKTLEEPAVVRVEERVAPIHRLAKRLMASRGDAQPRHQEPEAIAQTRGDLRDGKRSGSRGGELDREREPIEVTTDPLHDLG